MKYNKYFSYLNLPISKPKNKYLDKDYYYPTEWTGYCVHGVDEPEHQELVDFCNTVPNLAISHIVYLKTTKHGNMFIHTDSRSDMGKKLGKTGTSINFAYGPGCLQYFDVLDNSKIKLHTQIHGKYLSKHVLPNDFILAQTNKDLDANQDHISEVVSRKYCKLKCQTENDTERTVLTNVSEFHRGYNSSKTEDRYVIQYRLTKKDDPGYDLGYHEAIEMLKDYVVDLT